MDSDNHHHQWLELGRPARRTLKSRSMKEFENKIYRRLLAPVLACLVLALAGCSQDATEAEAPSSPTGGTYLTIVTRGINTTTPTEYEDYVKTLRVIIFDDAGNSIANLFLQNTDDDTTDEIPNHTPQTGDKTEVLLDEQNIGQISSGTYTFYCIANETGYSNIDGKSLSTILGVDKNISEEDLDGMQVKFTEDDIRKPTGTKYMLMSTKQNFLIRAGEENPITIVLDRALAKAQLVIQSTDKITDNIRVSLPKDKIPASYSLIKQETIESSKTFLDAGSILLEGGGEIFDDKALPDNDNVSNEYISQVVYLPERAATSISDALYYSIIIGKRTYDNQAPIAYKKSDQTMEYNIIRNYAYTTICTYDPAQPATLSLTYTVQPWGKGGGEHTFN